MRGKRVRFKDLEAEPNHSASCKFDASSAPYEATEHLPGYGLQKEVASLLLISECLKLYSLAFVDVLRYVLHL